MYTIISSKYQKWILVSCNDNINLTGPDTDRTYPTYFAKRYLEESMYS